MEGGGVAAGLISMGRNDFDNDRLGLVGAAVGPVVGLTLGCFVVGLTLGCFVGRWVGLIVG